MAEVGEAGEEAERVAAAAGEERLRRLEGAGGALPRRAQASVPHQRCCSL